MKKIILVLLFIISAAWSVQAQLQVTLNVDSNPTPELSEWVNRNNLAILTVTNPTDKFMPEYRIRVSLLLNGEMKLTTDESVPYMVAEFGTETFLADELIPYNAVQFVDAGFKDKIGRTGMLPPGSYSFCVELLNREGRSLTVPQQICRPMIITDYQMPELLSPIDGQEIDPLLINSLMFKWTPLVPIPDPRTGLTYLIAISEVQPGQTPSQAFGVNYPIIEEEVRTGTQFIWPIDIEAPEEDKQYVWGIKPMTEEGNTYRAKNNGFVNYGVFNVKGTNKSGEDEGDNDGNTKSLDKGIVNCNINPFELSKQLIAIPRDNNTKIDLTGISSLQNSYWMQVTGAIDPTKYQLVTTIDWGCTHSIDPVPYLTASKTHDYNNPNDHNIASPTAIKVSMELRPLQAGLEPCKIVVTKDLKSLSGEGDALVDTKGPPTSKACKFPSQNDFENIVNFIGSSPNDPLQIELADIQAFTMSLKAEVANGGNLSDVDVSLSVNYGGNHSVESEGDGMDMVIGHTYSYVCKHGVDTPTKVCLTYVARKIVKGKLISCEKTYCIALPQETIKAIEALVEPGADDNTAEKEPCACLNDSQVNIPDLTMEYAEDNDQHTLTIPDSPTTLQSIIDCMTTNELFYGSENMDGHPEYNYQAQFFTGTVTHNWHIPNAMNDPSNTHTFAVLGVNDQPLPEFVTVTYHIENPTAGIDCYFTQEVMIPHEAYNAINGIDPCECDLEVATPELTLLRPDAAEEPREIMLGGVTAYRDYLLNCNSNYSLATHSMEVTINWDGAHSEESIVNAGPFTHIFDANQHQIPIEICVTYAITPLFPSSDGQACLTTICLPVPADWQALNTAAVGNGPLAAGGSIFAGEQVNGQGEFEIITDTVIGNGPYSGTGSVYIPWLLAHVAVEFTNITVDAAANLVSGEITVVVSDDAPVYPYGCVGMGHDDANDIQAWLTTDGDIVDYAPSSGFMTPLEAPFGINFDSGDVIAVSAMVFKPTKSEFNLLAIKQFQPDVNPDQVLGFKACGTDFHPAAPVWPPERLELLEDITLGNINNKITYTFKAPVPGAGPGCFIEWGELGITNYAVEVDVDFTREWLIPVNEIDGTEKSTANLVGVGTNWHGLILTGNLEESILSATIPDPDNGTPTDSGAHDFIILADEIAFDMSDTMNTPGMAFPPIYTGETTNLFKGFYMDELTVKFTPNKMNTPNGGPVEVSINDMIIDNTGITLMAEAENLIAFGGAEVADMVASVDRIYLEILSSNFVEAGVEGRIAIPVNEGNGIDNSLGYTALFNNPLDPALNNNFQIILVPDQPIQNDLFGGGQFTLDETSNLTGYFDKDKKTFSMDLNGDLAWVDATVGPVDQINMALGFEGLGFDYDSSAPTNKLQFDQGNWAFASPQKKMANFPVTIEEVKFTQMPTTGTQLLHGKLNFDVIFNLSSKIGGRSTLGLVGAITDKKSSGGKTFDPEFLGVVIDSINVSADMAAVKINGAIGFRNNDPIYGNGFIGTLDAEFKVGGIKVGALAEFGNTDYNHSSLYRYWRVEANATFPAPGITFLPGVAFRGFGGGAFMNMIATPSGSDFIFTPKYDQIGFRANAVIATTPKDETFNADVGLLAAFSPSSGMTNIAFTGDFFVGAAIADRSKAKISGEVGVSYNFPDKRFILTADVSVNAPPITTPAPAGLILDINGKKNEWFFKFGEPGRLNVVKISGITLYEYMMFGNKIPYPGGFTPSFSTRYYNAVGNYPYAGSTGAGGVGSNTATGKGFALGIGFMFDESGEYKITKFNNGNRKHVLDWNLAAGAELHLSFMQYLGACGGYSPIGINGYRAKGGLGMYGSVGAGVTRYKKNGKTKWHINLASLKAGAWISGEFPKPNYAAGAVEGQVGLFDDLISFNFHQSFEYGTPCYNGGASSGTPVTQADAAAEQQNALITYVKASPGSEFPLTQPIIAKFGLAPNEVFDVSEQQSNGTVKMRTFKMIKTKSLKIKNETTGAWEQVIVGHSQNNLGEYLYVKQMPIEAMASVITMPLAPAFGSLPVAPPATVYMSMPSMTAMPAMLSAGVFVNTGPPGVTTYPVPPSNSYDDLPPDPDPVVNSLEYDRRYKFTVTATLKEYNGSSWITALKSNGTPVTETITKTFSTGPMGAITVGASTF
ncbi:hypothetical protein KCTC52924_00994 [Arenibacter antarcticus]|uniref:Por secretion system C-terminal sorting domain-containing protein n=1 Tax=Arenibacter antarcticus TaxID=2040469 RepID=A0ABW5VBH6_9FLAO|nr:hypothetical protein [Arenibacter sp. H213]MCM4167507.1 hypothetical protein [Arenibacter sp. H213]